MNKKMKHSGFNMYQNVWFLIHHAWQWDKVLFFYFTVYTILSSINPFISIFATKFLIDELLGHQRMDVLISILVVMFLAQSFVKFFVTYLKNLYEPKLVLVRFKFINMLQVKNMTMDFKHTENPETLNKMESAWKSVNNNQDGIEGVFHRIFSLFGSAISFIGYLSLIFTLSPWVLVYLITNVLVTYVLTLKVKKYEHDLKEKIASVDRRSNYIYQTMSDFSFGKDIRIYRLGSWLGNHFKHYKNERLSMTKDIQHRYFKVAVVDVLLLMVREGIIYGYLIFRVVKQGLSMGDFSMYFTTIGNFANLMKSVMDDLAFISIQNLYINGFRDYLALEDEPRLQTSEKIPTETPFEIEFKNVSFKYPNSETYVYEDLSFTIKAGQRLAIVGVNGAGKTTLVKLLTRLYEPTSGEILLNGIDIKKFNKTDYYELFSVVFQEIKMMAFSIAENVGAASREDLFDPRLNQSIIDAGLYEKIQSLEKGIETPLLKVLEDDGIELSGGQNQKLALARALYKNGEIVVLDEPTAALDAVAEYEIYQNFDKLVQNKTAIYISHRLSSTRFCDAIAFFEKGEIVEYGTHEELLKLNGKYAQMFNIQSQYYQDDVLEAV